MMQQTSILCSCSCRSLSTFRVGKWGEARAYSTAKLEDLYVNIRKSRLFNELPTNLANFEQWLPSFKLLPDTCSPLSSVHVILRPKSSASAQDLSEWQKNYRNLLNVWWSSIFIPAIRSLPHDTRTRRFNAVRAIQITGMLPTCVRLYKEDIVALDRALDARQLDDFEWYFITFAFGQRKLLDEDEAVGPETFGLGDMFDLTSVLKISIHIAMNFTFNDRVHSLFWALEPTYTWIRCKFLPCDYYHGQLRYFFIYNIM